MAFATFSILFTLILLAVILVGACLLQRKLSRMEKSWPGLILPGFTLFVSLLLLLGQFSYIGMSRLDILIALLPLMLFANIPTILFLIIYVRGREYLKKQKELNRMNIQDLE